MHLPDSSGHLIFAAGDAGEKVNTDDSHAPIMALSEMRTSPWLRPARLGADVPLTHRELAHISGWRIIRGML